MGADTGSLERRKTQRVPVAITVEIRDERGFSLHSTRDVSVGGVFFDRAIPHPVGAKVQLVLQIPGEGRPLRCEGEVANVPDKQGYGMGVRFLTISVPDTERLARFLDEVSGEETRV